MLPILYQDDHLVAIHKPSGLLVHRTALDWYERRFALQMLRDQLGRRVYPVHRLDKGTSGILLFALDQSMGRAMSMAFEEGRVQKRYWAIVRGWPAEIGEVDHALSRRVDDLEWLGESVEGGPQPAQTRYRRLATVELPYCVDKYPTSRYALVQLDPLTGRRHQIRRHLKHLSHPIIGDATYGKGRHNRLFEQLYGQSRLLLAGVGLRFRHPLSGEWLNIEAEPADGFAEVVQALGWQHCWPQRQFDWHQG
ncbi:pseudouridine synthase [Parachitinimonas caeni]|uniref:tRNA pseudouridine synthase C n=1 Tax=Parachitinimonas caeni TaxID=3031301 RepID=A0ABT7DW82_9NEIS|nr:pseudouridine synthase [Parachitinimonas caeni]MDK2124301.1 pseudouridine synthase [Parachitinimonas caeni]